MFNFFRGILSIKYTQDNLHITGQTKFCLLYKKLYLLPQ